MKTSYVIATAANVKTALVSLHAQSRCGGQRQKQQK